MSKRSEKQIREAEEEYFEKLWFYRHSQLASRYGKRGDTTPPDVIETARQNAERIKQKYSDEDLKSLSQYELGMLEGKLSALRWVLGDEWDELST